MASTFYIKRHDLLPAIQATLKDAAGTAIDLTGCTVEFHMWLEGVTTCKVDRTAVVVTPASGVVRYDWQGTDTDTAGEYNAEWEVTYPDTKTLTVPNYENDLVIITADAVETD